MRKGFRWTGDLKGSEVLVQAHRGQTLLLPLGPIRRFTTLSCQLITQKALELLTHN